MKVGERESFEPCTTTAEHSVLDMAALSDTLGTQKGYRLVLVDTPGLNAREKPDSEIVADIAKWSQDVYVPFHALQLALSVRKTDGCCTPSIPEGGCRGGIVFLNDLSWFQRIRDSDLRAFEQDFEMVIATTNWTTFRESDPEPYHKAVSSRWSSSSIRAPTHAFKGSTEDAVAIVRDLLARVEPWGEQLDIPVALDALTRRLEEKENQRRSVWEPFRNSIGMNSNTGNM
ncbi:hypothetical protein FA13DRAFT_304504 [Coprinellus micaceus]|jgi:hypothetical protein|uniref:G domain-containing protein n=1 Tax=Coprinellus micaceus TaxID=71717 RepID=A0A4Y7SFH7_COPMI|nr:hypothetical protein FA13DRAFT_304504 [Coprinellus micaceus]